MDIFNGFQINNPDGVLNENFDDWKKSTANGTNEIAKESSLSGQRETSQSEIVDPNRNNNGQNGADGRASSDALSSHAQPTPQSLSTTSVIGGGIGALTGALASTALATALVITMFVSALTINLSLIMADVNRLVVQIVMSGAQEEDFKTPIVAILDGDDGKHIVQNVYSDTLFLEFDGLSPNAEYSICVRNAEKIFDEKTFLTASKGANRGSVSAYMDGNDVIISAQNVVLEEREYYSVKAVDSRGEVVFGEDSQESDGFFKFTLTESKDLYITLDIGGKVFATCQINPKPWPVYDFENGSWDWTSDFKASVSFSEKNGGEPLVLPADVSEEITVSPECETDGEITYTATVNYGGVIYSDAQTDSIPALGHEYGDPTFTWTENSDGYTVTAEFTCSRGDSTETVAAEVVSVVTPPTSKKDGYTTYTATVVFEDEAYTDEKVIVDEGSALGYDYGDPVFTWTETSDGYTVTAKFFSEIGDHTEIVTAEVVTVVTDPTCEKDGYTTYTATVVFEEETYTDEKVTADEGSALGHDYDDPTFDWVETSDGYDVSAEFTCSRGDSTETVTADVVTVVTPPTETNDGYTTYTATVVFEDETYTDEKVVVDEGSALGYTYGEPVFTWTETSDGYSVTAKFTAESGDHTETVTAEVVPVVTPPACEKDGYTTYTATVVFEDETYTDEKVTVDEETALGHDYSQYYEGSDVQPTFTWTETSDGYTATAKFACSRGDHTETVTAEVVPVVTPSTCEEDGYTTYTAIVLFADVQYTDEKVVVDEGSAPGHDYSQYYEGSDTQPTFIWTATSDGYTATASFTCSYSDHTETVTAEVVPVVTPPTCLEDGYTTYTAIVLFEDVQYTDEKVVENANTALGHDYSQYYEGSDAQPTFIWTETSDGYTATAEFTCIRNDHTETVTAEVAPAVTPPSCEEDGYTTYTATAVFGDVQYIAQKVVVDEETALGHDYSQYYEGSNEQPTFVWTATSDGYSVTAKFICSQNDHTETVTAEVVPVVTPPSCEEDGYTTYTAIVLFEDVQYTDERVVENVNSALGHDYSQYYEGSDVKPTFTWTATSDGYSVTAKFTCSRNDHTETVTAGVVPVVTPPTCEEDGYTTYTATASFDNKTFTDEKVVVDEETALGHDYSQYYEGSNEKPTFIWTEDSDGGYTAKAVFYCKNNSSHKNEVAAEIGVEDGVDCLEGGTVYYYASVVFNNCTYNDIKEVEVEPGHDLIPVFHWTIMEEGYAVEFYMVCTREDYQDGPVEVSVNKSEGSDYTLYTATVIYDETEYTDQKKVLKTTKSVAVGEVFKPGDTMNIDGTVYFTDGFDDAQTTLVTGPVTMGSVGVEEEDQDTYDALAIYNNQFVRTDDNGWVVSEIPEWLFVPGNGMLVGVKIESGSGTQDSPYVLTPVYGEKVTYEANDGVFNVADGYSVTQYYTDEEIENGVYATPIPENPESSGKLFLGWYTDPDATEKFDFDNTPITESITLYAGWIRI